MDPKKREHMCLTICYFQTAGTLRSLVKELYLDLSAFVKRLENYLNRMVTSFLSQKLLILGVLLFCGFILFSP